jgi:xanthine dehydrogenase accessory factor
LVSRYDSEAITKTIYVGQDALKWTGRTGGPESLFLEKTSDYNRTVEILRPHPTMIIFGGGHIALAQHELAAKTHFAVTVVDDRPSFAHAARFPYAETVICESFAKCFERLIIDESAYVALVTRGHKHDLVCLRGILRRKVGYLGMIGSRRRIAVLKEQVLAEGYDPARVDALHAPIGLPIGAVTPEEIAVSIIAEAIRCKRLAPGGGPESPRRRKWADWDPAVLSALAMSEEAAADGKKCALAVVTVLRTHGSTPQEAGAKMVVRPDGQTIGTIGGGCAEANLIRQAIAVARYGGYRFEEIDLAGDAEDEGMVCGGMMQVLIVRLPYKTG